MAWRWYHPPHGHLALLVELVVGVLVGVNVSGQAEVANQDRGNRPIGYQKVAVGGGRNVGR